MRHQPVSFRLGPRERGVLEDLAERLDRAKVEVVRLAIRTLDESYATGAVEKESRPDANGAALENRC